jgi:tRNA/tmRNA/rRNA uracil-C5-methylase (TrmA/RlmC/RlmD family)
VPGKTRTTASKPGTTKPDDKRAIRPKPPKAKSEERSASRVDPRTTRTTFGGVLHALADEPSRPINRITLQAAPLAHFPYSQELQLKNRALAQFWESNRLPGVPAPIIASPRHRRYRTTSKRRTFLRGPYLYLVFGDKLLKTQKKGFLESPLEPPEHAAIYAFLQRKLSEPAYKLLASHLNHLIIRGNYRELAVIFNVRKMDGPLVRKLKVAAEHLRNLAGPVTAAFAYLDPTGSDYYFEKRRPDDKMQFKKLFGPAQLEVQFGRNRYQFHPTSFSQVNESIVETMLAQTRELLAPDRNERLIDLYCGYGLFSHYLAADYRKVTGIDAEGPSIRAAQANAKLNRTAAKCRFLARDITPKAISDLLPPSTEPLALILDPPRQGPHRGVIAAIGERAPEKILHIFCGVDQIPEALKKWQASNYQVEKVVPLDMFPGTANLEVLILLKKGR